MDRRLLLVGEGLVGGLGAVVIEQAEWFTNRGWQVTVATPPDPDGKWKDLAATFVPLAVPESTREVRRMAAAARDLRRLMRKLRPEVVHCHGVRPFIVARTASSHAPYVTLHGIGTIAEDPPGYRYVRSAGLTVVPRLARRAFSAAPLVGHGWEFVLHASPHLVALDRQPFPPPDSVPTFLWLARLDNRKPGDVFVRAIAALSHERPIRGIVAGDGPMHDMLVALIDELDAPVEMVGFKPPAPLLAEAWGLGLFSSQEAVTFAVQETMWTGRPVVSSPLPSLRWLTSDTGLLADDVDSAIDAFRQLCDHRTASRLGDRAAERARELIDPDSPWPVTEQAYVDDLESKA